MLEDSSQAAEQGPRNHRSELNRKARERYRAGIRKVDAAVLAAVQQDPRYEDRHGIRRYVICRVCGAKLKSLAQEHTRLHDLSLLEYQTGFPRSEVVCAALRAKRSAQLKRVNSERRHRAWRDMHSVNAHPGEGSARRWPVASLLVRGTATTEICKRVRRSFSAVRCMAYSVGLRLHCRHDLGKPVTRGYVLRLREAVGLNPVQFAEFFGIPGKLAIDVARPGTASRRIAVAHADSIIAARDRFIREIADAARKRMLRTTGPNSTRVLRSMIPDFREICRSLRKGLGLTRKFLRSTPAASITDWQDWLCDEAWREVDRKRPGLFTAFLPLAAETSQFVEPQLTALRLPGLHATAATTRTLAARFGVGSIIVAAERAKPLKPGEMKDLILPRSPGRQAVPSDHAIATIPKKIRKHGPDKTPFQETAAFKIGEEVDHLAARLSRTEARKEVTENHRLEYDTVRRYDQEFLRYRSSKVG